MLVAIALLTVAILPLAYSFVADQRAMRSSYEHAVAMQLLDGEMEVLAAGAWRTYPSGTNRVTLHGKASVNLSNQEATLIIDPKFIRLEWNAPGRMGGPIVRVMQHP